MTETLDLSTMMPQWPDIPLSAAAEEVLQARYLRGDELTGSDVFRRTALAVAQAEGQYDEDPTHWANRFYHELFEPLLFIPNSPTLANAGTDRGCLSACFVISPQDSMEHIGQTLKEWMLTEKWGGGIGAFFGNLRPSGSAISSIHGVAFGPVGAMQFFAATSGRVTQGSFRPGAHMAQLQISHPDIRAFIHCKDDARRYEALKQVAERQGWGHLIPAQLAHPLANFNISVQVPDAFMVAVERGAPWPLIDPHDNRMVETVDARELWQELCESAHKTGDPGIVLIDRVRETAPNPQLGPIESSNPCLAEGTLVATPSGWIPVEDVPPGSPITTEDGASRLVNSVERHEDYPIYRVLLGDGAELLATAAHCFWLTNGQAKRLDEMIPGDRIRIAPATMPDNPTPDRPEGWSERDWGFYVGVLLGDGGLTGTGRNAARTSISVDSAEDAWVARIGQMVSHVNGGTTALIDQSKVYPRSAKFWMEAGQQTTLLERVTSPFKAIPLAYQNSNRGFLSGLLDGLFSTDGDVNTRGNGVQLRLTTSSKQLARDTRRVLLSFGIHARVYPRSQGSGIIHGRHIIERHQRYTVMVYGEGFRRFAQEIGLSRDRKQALLQKGAAQSFSAKSRETWWAELRSVEPAGNAVVYDLHEPETDTWLTEGVVNQGCGEEFLPQHGSCNLGSIDLSKHLSAAAGTFDWKKLGETTELAVRFLDDVITVNSFPLPEQKAINEQERRIGLGVMGWADALLELGIPYDSAEAIALGEEVAQQLRDAAWEASAKLARQRGAYPAFQESALKRRLAGLYGATGLIADHGVRNANVLTIAPTGSISIFSGCSSGIEPPFAAVWRRHSLWKSDTQHQTTFVECPGPVRRWLDRHMGMERADHLLWSALEVEDPITDSEPFLREHAPGLDLSVLRTAHNIAPEWHVRHQAVWQRYVTNSVSKTVNMPESATVDDVEAAFKLAWREGVKATTVYRHNSRLFQVLDVGEGIKRETDKGDARYVTTARSRPRALYGRTLSMHTGDGHVYITFNQDEDGAPFEVFANVGKAGTDAAAYTEAVGRLVSLHFRRGGTVEEVIGQLRGITGSQPIWDDGRKVLSVPDAIAIALAEITKAAEHGPHEIAEAVTEAVNGAHPVQPVAGARFICRVCSGTSSHPEGACEVCDSCGWSKCE